MPQQDSVILLWRERATRMRHLRRLRKEESRGRQCKLQERKGENPGAARRPRAPLHRRARDATSLARKADDHHAPSCRRRDYKNRRRQQDSVSIKSLSYRISPRPQYHKIKKSRNRLRDFFVLGIVNYLTNLTDLTAPLL